MNNRRHFLKNSSALLTFTTVCQPIWVNALSANSPFAGKIGLQLWTVRNQMAKSIPNTLKAVKNAGYFQVEMGDVVGAEETVKAAKDLGLEITSSFVNWETLTKGGIEQSIDIAKALGLKHLVFGYVGKGHRETKAHFQRIAEFLNKTGDLCSNVGIQLNYHNHSFEFSPFEGEKSCGYDVLINELDHEKAKFELDIFWAAVGGWDPLELMNRLKGRIAQLHLKDKLKGTGTIYDESKVPNEAFKEVGQGVIDMARILESAARHGVDQCHVEQDQSPDPLVSIAQSLAYLNKLN